MGFFSSVISPLLGTAATIFGGAAAGTAIAGLLGGTEVAKASAGGIQAAVQAGTITAPGVAAVIGGVAGACPVSTGGMRKITIVQTVDANGRVCKQVTHKGGVAVFASDVAAANRVARQVSQLNKRMPRKTVKESQTTQLKNRLVNNALEQAGDKACPK